MKNAPGNWFEEKRSSERRSIEVLETSSDIPQRVRDGITKRVNAVMTEISEDNIFSASGAIALREHALAIIAKGGCITIHEKNDPFGKPFVQRQKNGEFIFTEISKDATIRIRRLPFVSIPGEQGNLDALRAKLRNKSLRFEYSPAETMAVMVVYENGDCGETYYIPVGSIEREPVDDRYGQTIFGGIRLVQLKDGRIAAFRLDQHMKRFADNALRLKMGPLDPKKLREIVLQIGRVNKDFVPPHGKGGLYVAPGYRAVGNQVGVHPHEKYLFTCEVMPVSKLFSEPSRIRTETEKHRAAKGGVGNIKASGNYAASFETKMSAEVEGYNDVLFLDESNNEIRELSSSNVFFVTHNGVLITPSLSGEILPGITRESILEIAQELKEQGIIHGIEERPMKISELKNMKEAFSCGTGVTMNPIASITHQGEKLSFRGSKVTHALHKRFQKILAGECMDHPRYKNWLTMIE